MKADLVGPSRAGGVGGVLAAVFALMASSLAVGAQVAPPAPTVFSADLGDPIRSAWVEPGGAGRLFVELAGVADATYAVSTSTVAGDIGRITIAIQAGAVTATAERWSSSGWVAVPGTPRTSLEGNVVETSIPETGPRSLEEILLVLSQIGVDNVPTWMSPPIRLEQLKIGTAISPAPWSWKGDLPEAGRWEPDAASTPSLRITEGLMEIIVPPRPTEIDGVTVAEVDDRVRVRSEGLGQDPTFELRVLPATEELVATAFGSETLLPAASEPLQPEPGAGGPGEDAGPAGGPWRQGIALTSGGVAVYQVEGATLSAVIGEGLGPEAGFSLDRRIELVDGTRVELPSLVLSSPALVVDPGADPTGDPSEARWSLPIILAFLVVCGIGAAVIVRETRQSSWWRRRKVGRRWKKRMKAEGREIA